MKRIIVLTDFSNAAENTLYYVAEIAEVIEAHLHIVYIYQLPITMTDVPALMIAPEEIKKTTDDSLSRYKDILQTKYERLPITIESRLGDVIEELKDISKERDIFAIVIGNHHASGIEHLIFGNTTLSIIRNSMNPVIAVPDNFLAKGIKNIALATDFQELDKFPADYINRFLQKVQVPLHIIHVQAQESAYTTPNQLLHLLSGVKPSYHVINSNDYVEGIQLYIKEHSIDLLIIVPHQHSLLERLFFKTHTVELVKDIDIPVMCVNG